MQGIAGFYLTPEDTAEFYERHKDLRGQHRIDPFLTYIDEIKASQKGDPTERTLLALSAYVRWALSVELEKSSREAEAMDQIVEAIA